MPHQWEDTQAEPSRSGGGELMGTDKRQVSIWRGFAVEDGYLREVKPHKFIPGKNPRRMNSRPSWVTRVRRSKTAR